WGAMRVASAGGPGTRTGGGPGSDPVGGRFFFSSRRRHTRLVSDWSADVCSSDLAPSAAGHDGRRRALPEEGAGERRDDERQGGGIGRASCRERAETSGGGG